MSTKQRKIPENAMRCWVKILVETYILVNLSLKCMIQFTFEETFYHKKFD